MASALAVLSLALGGASCDKKSAANPTDPGPSVPFEAPTKPAVKAEAAPKPAATADAAPAAIGAKAEATGAKALATGAKPEAAPAAAGGRFEALAEKLPSPCGKAESLKRTLEADRCKSAPFARRFVEGLVKLDVGDDEIEEMYRNRFGAREEHHFALRETPFEGPPNAPVQVVEFYDYACPHCREAAPVIEQVLEAHPHDLTVFFKQYPLHKDSMDLARGALAAQRQGKFKQVHRKLFEAQSRDDVLKIAAAAGLDMDRFKKDMDDPAINARILADKEEGQRAKVQGTPTLFINDRMYMDALTADRMGDWIDEEIAVNR